MTKIQNINKLRVSKIKFQKSPIWMLDIGYRILFGYCILCLVSCILSIPAAALDNPEQKVTKLVEGLVISYDPKLTGLDISVTYRMADKAFDILRGLSPNADLKIKETYKDFRPVGNVIFPIEVFDGKDKSTIFIRAKVEVFLGIVAAAKKIKRGQEIKRDDLALEKRDIAMLPQKYFTSFDQVSGREAKTTIPQNSTVFSWMIKEVPQARRGDSVTIFVRAPNLLLKTSGIALMDGYIGGKITVRKKETKKTLEGILIAPGEVEVVLK
ncbi:MAG: flagellar basal body P-ring formation protein FlgA [Candidatus Saganbacteria bacterium]|nr:flagellar basal body P-ring formation protein FlgA [Candidatus Saganbacteria bacterium]